MHAQNITFRELQVVQNSSQPIAAQVEVLDAEHGAIALQLERSIAAGEFRINVAWNASYDESLSGVYKTSSGGEPYVFTQFEPTSARRAFPCFDEPAFKAQFDLAIVAPEGLLAVANTRETARASQPNGRTLFRFARTMPLSTYLVAFAVGAFDVREGSLPPNDVRISELPFRILSVRGSRAETEYAFAHTEPVVRALENYFGMAYPFDKLDFVAVPDFSAGAMENAGLITFRDNFLRLGDGPSQAQRESFTYVAAHELGHQWFGNFVTMEFWDDLWLNEAFASWMETQIVQSAAPEYESALSGLSEAAGAMAADTLSSARIIREPIRAYGDIVNAFDTITYAKGSRVLEMIEAWLGRDTFQRGVRSYMQRHRFANAGYNDLVAALAEAAPPEQRSLVTQVFADFCNQTGVPLVTIARGGEVDTYALSVREYRPLGSVAPRDAPPKSWHVPVCVKAPGADGGWVRACTIASNEPTLLRLPGAREGVVVGNAEGAGYFVYTLGEGLRAPSAYENELDELAVAQNTRAELRAGTLGFADALARLAPLSQRPNRLLSAQALELLSWAEHELVSAAEAPYFRRYVRSLFENQAARFGFFEGRNETLHTRSQRDQALRAQLFLAEDGVLRREARRLAAEVLRGNWDAVAPDVVAAVLCAEVQFGGAQAFSRVLTRFRQEGVPGHRRALLGALTCARGTLSADVLALTLSPDLRDNEVRVVVLGVLAHAEPRELVLTFVRDNFNVLRSRLGEDTVDLARILSSAKSSEDISRWHATLAQLLATTDGSERALHLALEEAQQRVARIERETDSARTLFSARGTVAR